MDELTAPLGRSSVPQRRLSIARRIALGLGVLLLASGAVWYGVSTGLLRGKQTAAAPAPLPVQVQAPPTGSAAAPDPTGAIRNAADDAARRTVTIIDGMSGKRQEVVIGTPEPTPGAGAGAAAGQRSR